MPRRKAAGIPAAVITAAIISTVLIPRSLLEDPLSKLPSIEVDSATAIAKPLTRNMLKVAEASAASLVTISEKETEVAPL
ncbi:hypothetical protein LBMAG14_14560 [Actinomycetes bacterium]|nr:hypothetical protein LBMAG14_14560 [Actinomycetes bacterium]